MSDEPQEDYGIYGNCIQQKGDPDILAKSEDSVQDRFGLGDNDSANEDALERTDPYMEGGES